jgi:hypothetical protein
MQCFFPFFLPFIYVTLFLWFSYNVRFLPDLTHSFYPLFLFSIYEFFYNFKCFDFYLHKLNEIVFSPIWTTFHSIPNSLFLCLPFTVTDSPTHRNVTRARFLFHFHHRIGLLKNWKQRKTNFNTYLFYD